MHIGMIPDGNRRFMRKRGISNLEESYRMGINKFHQFLEWCIELGVKEVTIYALSLENLKNRSSNEVSTLLKLFSDNAAKALDDDRIHKNRVHINFCGDREYLSNLGNPIGSEVIHDMDRLEKCTRDYDDLKFNIALAYGGRQEILNAVRKVMDSGMELNEENLQRNLWISDYPEIVIRTAESRLSNFLLWQSAYSEIYFIDKLWQEIEKDDLVNVLNDYRAKERRFGR
jgi:tritrans,polycis-undecaprenyl-diphosphate synthase [geranylgeranyl-diphosphate specific]